MKKLYSFMTKFGGVVAAFAVVVTSFTANSACVWLAYQPEEPEEVKALKKTEYPKNRPPINFIRKSRLSIVLFLQAYILDPVPIA